MFSVLLYKLLREMYKLIQRRGEVAITNTQFHLTKP